MSRQHLTILLIVTIVLAVVAALVAQLMRPEQGSVVGTRLYPELEAQINDIARIESQTAGEKPTTIALKNGAWRVADRWDYPANSLHLRQNLLILARLELIEEKTKIPSKYAIINVQDVNEATDTTQAITLFDAKGGKLADVIVGKLGPNTGSYVRRQGEAQSWLTSSQIHMPVNSAEWLELDLFDIDEDRIRKVSVQPPAGDAYSIEKSAQDEKTFTLTPLPEGMKAAYSHVGRLARVFDEQRLQDVLINAEADKDTTAWTEITAQTFDGLTLEIQARLIGEAYQIRGMASHQASDGLTPELAAQIADQAKEINTRMAGWTFILASYRAAPFLADLQTLLEAVEEE